MLSISQIMTIDLWMIIPLFLIGSTLHFVYNWSNHRKEVAIISAVNESYWEHIKIAFWPVIILYVFEFALGGYKYTSFIPAKTIALYTIPVSMVAIVFCYKFFTKKNILFVDISVFLITIILAQVIGALLLTQISPTTTTILLSLGFLFFITIGFTVFTLKPPKEPDIFKDPLTSKYGLKGHK
jgi:hypothetical protein